jgi:hypothetical protein
MSRYSIEELQKKLDKQLSWRKKELTILKNNVNATEGYELNTSIRTAITLLYAHWEGFIKMAAREYLKYLNSLNLKCYEMKDNFITLSIKTIIVKTRDSNKSKIHSEVVNEILNNKDKTFNVDVMNKLIVDTDSNLSDDILEDILFSLGFDSSVFGLRENYIKDNLVNERNKIAHGEYTQFVNRKINITEAEKNAKQTFNTLYEEILKVIDLFKDQILDACQKKLYLKNVECNS